MITDPRARPKLVKRRAITSILAALILFAMIFSVGLAYFTAVNSNQALNNAAAAERQSSANGLGQEKLSLVPTVCGTNLCLEVANSGGSSSTIVAAFITTQSGSLWQASDGKVYLTSPTDLSIGGSSTLELPLSLSVGQNTSLMSCSTYGCDLIFSSYTYTTGSTILLSVLTKDGNVFSVQYPPSLTTATEISDVTSDITTVESLTDTVTSSVTNIVTDTTTTIGCYACSDTAIAGGDTLVVTIVGTPSPVQTGGTIDVEVTVSDYSSYAANDVSVTLSYDEVGTATLGTQGGTCGSSLSVSADSSTSCTATFVANSNAFGGTVVFQGYVVGCVQTGSSTTCSAGTGGGPGTTITSATSSSNPVQVGSLLSVGPWSPNFNYFKYTAANEHTETNAAIIPDTATYVTIYVQVTNTYNSTLDLLDYSYAQFISPGSDVDAYIVSGVSYSGSTGTITATSCTDTPPSAPTGTCVAVAPGSTVTVEFAASSAGGTTWEWGNADQGGTNIGTTVQIVMAFSYQTSSGSYAIGAQNIPFQSVYVQ